MLAAARVHNYRLGLFDRLLILGIEVVCGQPHLIRDLARLGVEQMRLEAVLSERRTDEILKARILYRIEKRVKLRHVFGTVHHIACPAYFCYIRLIRGGQKAVFPDHPEAVVLFKIICRELRPDIHSRLRRLGRAQVGKIHAVRSDKSVLGSTEDDVGAALHSGYDYRIKHKAQSKHSYDPHCFLLHSRTVLSFKIGNILCLLMDYSTNLLQIQVCRRYVSSTVSPRY